MTSYGSHIESKFAALPSIPEHVAQKIISEVENFATALKHDPESARRDVEADITWLHDHKDFLGRVVGASVDSALDLYSEKLTHRDWVELRLFLLKGVLLTLEATNEALKERRQM